MAIAIVGGTGFIGSEVAARIVDKAEPLLVLSRGHRQQTLPENAVFERADRMNTDALISLFTKYQVEAVVDMLPLSLSNTQPLLEAAATSGARYVMVSSADVYGNYGGLQRRETPKVEDPLTEEAPLRATRHPFREPTPRAEDDPQKHFDEYDKIPVEEAARADARLAATVLRLPMVYGPGDPQHRFGWMVRAAQQGGDFAIDERVAGWRSTCGFVTDVAEAIALAALLPRAANRTYNVGEAHTRTTAEWLAFVAHMLQRELTVVPVPPEQKGAMWEMAEGADLEYPLEMDTLRIRAELGFGEVVSEEEAMLRTIAWEQGALEHPGAATGPEQASS